MALLRAPVPFIPPLLLLLASVIGTAAMPGAALPARGAVASRAEPSVAPPSLAVAFPPWWSGGAAVRAVAAARGSVLAVGVWPFALLATAPDAAFSARLRAAGAWWVAASAAGGCAPTPGAGR